MERKYLKEMTKEEVRQIVKGNERLRGEIYDRCYEGNMFIQSEQTELILGKEWHQYIDYHDHYQSFYLTVRNVERTLRNLDTDYMGESDAEKTEEVRKLLEKWDDMTWEEQEENEDLWTEIEEKTGELVSSVERDLHEYEDISDDQFDAEVDWFYENECDNMYVLGGALDAVYMDSVIEYK